MKLDNILLCFSLFFAVEISAQADYYWRPFNGTAPEDAVLLGEDGNGLQYYVGNAPVYGGGLYVGALHPGVKSITVTGASLSSDASVHVITENIEILCSRTPQWFVFAPVNSTNLHEMPNELIQGGYEGQDFGTLYIGGIDYKDTVKIGKVCGYWYNEDDVLFIADGEHEYGFESYSVLVWAPSETNEKSNFKKLFN